MVYSMSGFIKDTMILQGHVLVMNTISACMKEYPADAGDHSTGTP